MYVFKVDENHNIPMKQVVYASGNYEKCVGLTAKIN